MSWWRNILPAPAKPSQAGTVSEPPLVASIGRRRPMPLAGGLPADDVVDEPPDKTGTVRTVLHLFCDGKTCSHD
jgi:hypothetical protein